MLTIKIASGGSVRIVTVNADVTCKLSDIKEHFKAGEKVFMIKDSMGNQVANSEEITEDMMLANNYKLYMETSAKGAGLLEELQSPASNLVKGDSVRAVLMTVVSAMEESLSALHKELEENHITMEELISDENMEKLEVKLESLKAEQANRFIVHQNIKKEEYMEEMRKHFQTVQGIKQFGAQYLIEYIKVSSTTVPNYYLDSNFNPMFNHPYSLDKLQEMDPMSLNPTILAIQNRIDRIELEIDQISKDIQCLKDGIEELFED